MIGAGLKMPVAPGEFRIVDARLLTDFANGSIFWLLSVFTDTLGEVPVLVGAQHQDQPVRARLANDNRAAGQLAYRVFHAIRSRQNPRSGGAQYINVPETVTIFGREITFLGGSDLALQVIIWSIPIGFVNSVTQFVLIAVNQQHFLTRAFIFGVVFNTVGNLLLIPYLGYIGAAFVTILSEFSLLFPFYYSVKRNVGTVSWLRVFAPPAASVAVMGLVIFLLSRNGLNVWLAVLLSWGVYTVLLVITGAFKGKEMAMLGEQLPVGPLRRLMVRGA